MLALTPRLERAKRGDTIEADEIAEVAGCTFERIELRARKWLFTARGIRTARRNGDLYLLTLDEQLKQPHERVRRIDRETQRAELDLVGVATETVSLTPVQVRELDRTSNMVHSLRSATKGTREESRYLLAGKDPPRLTTGR